MSVLENVKFNDQSAEFDYAGFRWTNESVIAAQIAYELDDLTLAFRFAQEEDFDERLRKIINNNSLHEFSNLVDVNLLRKVSGKLVELYKNVEFWGDPDITKITFIESDISIVIVESEEYGRNVYAISRLGTVEDESWVGELRKAEYEGALYYLTTYTSMAYTSGSGILAKLALLLDEANDKFGGSEHVLAENDEEDWDFEDEEESLFDTHSENLTPKQEVAQSLASNIWSILEGQVVGEVPVDEYYDVTGEELSYGKE